MVDVLGSYFSGQITQSYTDYCSFLNKSWKTRWAQVRPRACTSVPPSLSFPSLTGANPSC
jgi:Fe-S-cluster containining protein